MQGFVRSREGRAASPVPKGSQNANTSRRQLIASNARIGVPPTHFSSQHTRQPSQPGSRQESVHGQMSPPPKPSSQHIKQEDRVLMRAQKRDPYDTDAESLDTTIHSRGEMLVEDQLGEPGVLFAEHSSSRNNYSGSEPEGSEVEEGEEPEEDNRDEENMFNRALKLRELQHEIFHGNPADQPQTFNADDSYPTTTSGQLDDDETVEEPPSDLVDEENISQTQTQDQQRQHVSHRFQHSQPTTQGQQRPPINPKSIFQKGQALREANRPSPNLTPRQTVPPPTPSRPQNEPVHKKNNVRYQQNFSDQTSHPTPQSVQDYPDDQFQHARNESVVSTITGAHLHQLSALGFTNEENGRIPFEDYELSELCKMSYDELKLQSLDYNPRAPPPVIPEDMMQASLSERLEFVQHHLEAHDQRKFFDSLPIKEWEEAGNWFADQFGDIIKKMADARRKKRKVAIEFEQEIEMRHKHVAKRQQIVEDAMKKMRASGQGLLPKTPKRNI